MASFYAGCLQLATFACAMGANAIYGSRLGTLSRETFAGGLNVSVWAFSVWGIIYSLFSIGYVQWALAQAGVLAAAPALSSTFVLAWVANAAWLLAFTQRKFFASLGLLFLYIAVVLVALPSVTASSLSFVGAGTILSAVWLVAAAFLNAQLLLPHGSLTVYAASATLAIASLGGYILSLDRRPGEKAIGIFGVVWILVALLPWGRKMGDA
jgi:hypothetical protein